MKELVRKTLHDIKCGLHSNIPICCVSFWILTYSKCKFVNRTQKSVKVRNKDGTISFVKLDEPLGYIGFCRWLQHNFKTFIFNKVPHWGYVPCPICFLRNNRKETKRCDCYER